MNLKCTVQTAIATALLTVSAFASALAVPTQFNLTGTSFVIGSGYGNDPSELAVDFDTVAAPGMFGLTELNPTKTFKFGTIRFHEQ